MKRGINLLLAAGLSIGLATGIYFAWTVGHTHSSVSASARLPGDGHQRMLGMLDEIRVHTRQSDPLTGQTQLDMASAMLANLTTDSPLADQINIRARLGDIQLMQGDTAGAAKNLAEAYDLLLPVRTRIAPDVEQHALLDVAVAHLRLGEVNNCIQCSTCDSCILPIRAPGVHKQPFGSQKAVEYLQRLLELNPST